MVQNSGEQVNPLAEIPEKLPILPPMKKLTHDEISQRRYSLEQLQAAERLPVIVLLDNMNDIQLRKAVKRVRSVAPHIKLEASGNMNLARVRRLQNTGLDFISVGGITHSVKALDLSLKIGNDVPVKKETSRGRK